jgi:hypothetical protein
MSDLVLQMCQLGLFEGKQGSHLASIRGLRGIVNNAALKLYPHVPFSRRPMVGSPRHQERVQADDRMRRK